MPHPRDTAEHFVQMQFRPTRMRIQAVLPIDDEDTQLLQQPGQSRIRV